ncbi:hypothetical protein LCGC14_2675150 [marine sediment metagenome]|uniref:Uncharacterized protein n=1 Tax=marine sediment metagenome TaxID=412755 RepID=A0A0F9AAH5_9ZZZZ
MILDSLLLLSSAQDFSQTTGDYYSTNVINASVTRDIGPGEQLALIVVVDEAFTSSSSTATVIFSVIDEADTTLDSSSVEIVKTDTLVVTRLTLGKIIVIPIPAGLITQQYLGMRVDIGTDTTTAGTVTAFIGPANFAQTWNA